MLFFRGVPPQQFDTEALGLVVLFSPAKIEAQHSVENNEM